jgi:hypothetical protein
MLVADYEELLISVLAEHPDINIVVSGVLPRFQDQWKLYRQDDNLKVLNEKAKKLNGKFISRV